MGKGRTTTPMNSWTGIMTDMIHVVVAHQKALKAITITRTRPITITKIRRVNPNQIQIRSISVGDKRVRSTMTKIVLVALLIPLIAVTENILIRLTER